MAAVDRFPDDAALRRLALRERRWSNATFYAGSGLIAFAVLLALVGPLLAPYDPNEVVPTTDGWLARSVDGDEVIEEPVATPEDLVASAHLTERGLFVPVVHPDWGERRLVGLPWRRYGDPAMPLGAPPLLTPPSGGPG